MPTSFTTNLRLSNPGLGDTGWGSTVSNGMIDLVDPAIAGTTTLSADTDVILTTANGMTDQARQMILNCTGSRAAQRTITAPASSKVYVVINGTTGGFGVKIVGVGPTTGVVVPAGRMAVVAWNGSDFVTLGAVVDLTASGNVTVAGNLGIGTTSPTQKLSVNNSTAVNTYASFSNPNATNGNYIGTAANGDGVVGTIDAKPLLFLAGALERMRLDASGNLGLGVNPSTSLGTSIKLFVNGASGGGIESFYNNLGGFALVPPPTGAGLIFYTFTGGVGAESYSERMRLDASGNLGIGTSSPGVKLDVNGNARLSNGTGFTTANSLVRQLESVAGAANQFTIGSIGFFTGGFSDQGQIVFSTNNSGGNTERMRLDASGNLGLGVTPSAWSTSVQTALQVYTAGVSGNGGGNTASRFTHGAYLDGSTWKYQYTGVGPARYEITGPNSGSTHSWSIAAGGTAGNAISFTQAMTLDASGNLLVGATVNYSRLTVSNGLSTRSGITISDQNTASLMLFAGNNSDAVIAIDTNNLVFKTGATAGQDNGTERARFTAVGDFLVGLTSAQTWGIDGGGAFQVGGGRPCILGTSGGNISFKGDSGGWSMGLYANGSNNTYRGGFGFVGSADSLTYYWVGTAFNGTGVQLTSGGTSWSTLSDSRDKNIYGEIENALEKIGGIRSVYYSFKTDDQSAPRRVGFIAQEVQAVLPEAVSEVQRELENPTEESKRLMLSYTEVIPLLTKAIQEQQALITELRTRVAALEVK